MSHLIDEKKPTYDELLSELKAYKSLINDSLEIEMNCSDFFAYSTAWVLTIYPEDLKWIIPFIQKHEKEGINAVCAYIENLKPLKHYITEEFEIAIKELIDSNQKVCSDVDVWSKKGSAGDYRIFG